MKFFIKNLFSKCDRIRSTNLNMFTEQIRNEKFHFGAGDFFLIFS